MRLMVLLLRFGRLKSLFPHLLFGENINTHIWLSSFLAVSYPQSGALFIRFDRCYHIQSDLICLKISSV